MLVNLWVWAQKALHSEQFFTSCFQKTVDIKWCYSFFLYKKSSEGHTSSLVISLRTVSENSVWKVFMSCGPTCTALFRLVTNLVLFWRLPTNSPSSIAIFQHMPGVQYHFLCSIVMARNGWEFTILFCALSYPGCTLVYSRVAHVQQACYYMSGNAIISFMLHEGLMLTQGRSSPAHVTRSPGWWT